MKVFAICLRSPWNLSATNRGHAAIASSWVISGSRLAIHHPAPKPTPAIPTVTMIRDRRVMLTSRQQWLLSGRHASWSFSCRSTRSDERQHVRALLPPIFPEDGFDAKLALALDHYANVVAED